MSGRPSQCFLFQSCGRRVENATFDCLLNRENTLGVEPFVASEEECQVLCQKVSNNHQTTNSESTNFYYDLFFDWRTETKNCFGPIKSLFSLSTAQTEKNWGKQDLLFGGLIP